MSKQLSTRKADTQLFYPIMHNTMTDEETKAYHRKRRYEMSKPEAEPGELVFKVDGSVWKKGKLISERPTEEREEWVKRRMRVSARSWEVWNK